MRLRLLLAPLAALAIAGCDSVLESDPVYELPDDQAITDASGARGALAGAYDALQDGAYYGESFLSYLDLSADNAYHAGTFTDYADADANVLVADNTTIEAIWASIYQAVGRVNDIIAKVPSIDMDPDERDDLVGQAYFLRALHYHNLVKVWGDVPLRLEPPASAEEAAQIARAPVAQVYQQILADLDQAEQLISSSGDTRRANPAAVHALRARVLLYMGDWAGAEAAAEAVEAEGVSLAPRYADLFDDQGANTPEDIFRVSFTAVEYNFIGYYYQTRSYGGRREQAPEWDVIDAYGYSSDPSYDPDTVQTTDDDGNLLYAPIDERAKWTISFDPSDRRFVAKYPTVAGTEHLHVIRYGEVLLIRAEAEARQGKYAEAVATMNELRARAGVPLYTYNAAETPGDGDLELADEDVVDAVILERRLELAFEGDRWPDLVRLGLVEDVMGLDPEQAYQALYPIPQQEVDVAPNLVQNPGY